MCQHGNFLENSSALSVFVVHNEIEHENIFVTSEKWQMFKKFSTKACFILHQNCFNFFKAVQTFEQDFAAKNCKNATKFFKCKLEIDFEVPQIFTATKAHKFNKMATIFAAYRDPISSKLNQFLIVSRSSKTMATCIAELLSYAVSQAH